MLNGKFSRLELIWFFAAAVLVVVGDQFAIPMAFRLGLMCAGVLVTLYGAGQVISRLSVYRLGLASIAQAVQLYRGVLAQVWGLIVMGIGAALVLVPLMQWLAPSQANAIGRALQNSPAALGLVLGVIGLMTALHGLIRALAGSSGSEVGRIAGFRDAVDRLMGAGTFLLGLGIAFVGVTLVVAPGMWKTIFDQLASMIVGP
ncbi:MAG: hypothetical protein ACK2T0_14265 [Anaerolineales bacterium]